jgi:hypothetical protein
MIKSTLLAAALALGMVSSASALTVNMTIQSFGTNPNQALLNNAISAFDASAWAGVTYENFEDFNPCQSKGACGGDVGTPELLTNVGTFEGLGGSTPTGSTAVGNGVDVAVKAKGSDDDGGRMNTTDGGKKWLDSNDRQSVKWKLPNVETLIHKVGFFLSDPNDVGARVLFEGNDTPATVLGANPFLISVESGSVFFVTLFFDGPVKAKDLTVELLGRAGDGVGVDDPRFAAVPLPPTVLLLGSAFVGAAFLRRRKAQRA